MSRPISQDPSFLPGQQGVDPARAAGEAAPKASRPLEGPAFHVLLEQLQQKAQALESTSQTLEDPRSLAGAVDMARASLDDALSLSDRLLEAFRAAQHSDADEPSESTPLEDQR